MERYDQNSFYFNITENLWCWKQTSTGKIFKAKTKSELTKIKDSQFVGSGNYEREYNLGEGLISTEEFGKITGVGTKQYISLLLRGELLLLIIMRNQLVVMAYISQRAEEKKVSFLLIV